MAQLAANPEEVRASHILVKHKESRRLASWKDPNGDALKKRSVADADKILLSYLKQINESNDSVATFHQIASKYSDCSSANANPAGTYILTYGLFIPIHSGFYFLTRRFGQF